MAYDGGTAVVRVIADAKGLNASLAAATKGAQSTFGKIGSAISTALTNPLVLGGAALTGVVAKLGFEFEDAFTRIGAISNASAKDIEAWKGQVMSLAGETAQAPKELADALFFLSSAGLDAAQIMPALEASAKASAVGLGETADIANITASALNAYAGSGLTAAQVTDTLVAAVREGRAEPEEFAAALGRILPIASQVGVTFDQVTGSLAGLSNIGLDVNEAVTAMRGALQAVAAPGSQAANALSDVGLTAQDLLDAISEDGLFGALQMLDKAAKSQTSTQAEYIGVLRKIIPNVRALTGVLGLTGQEAEKVRAIFDATANSTGSLDEAMNTTAQGPAFQFRKALNELVVIGTEIGQKVLPAITDVLEMLSPLLQTTAKFAKALLVAFLAYKAITFLPKLLVGIGTALQALGAKSAASAVTTKGLGLAMGGIGGVAGIAALAIGGMVAANQSLHASNEAARQSTVAFMDDLIARITQGGDAAAGALADFDELFGSMPGWALETLGLGDNFDVARQKVLDSAEAVRRHANAEFYMSLRAEETKKGLKGVAGAAALTEKQLEQLNAVMEDVSPQFDAMAGGLAGVKRGFALTAQAASTSATTLGAKQKNILKDLRELDDAKIGDKLKARIAALGPDMVHAFVTGTEKQRAAIREGLRVYDRALQATNQMLRGIMKRGGISSSKAFVDGGVSGIDANGPTLVDRYHQLGLDAQSAFDRAIQAKSPSRTAYRSGVWWVEGLIKGLDAKSRDLTRTIQKLADLIQTVMDDEVKDALTKSQLDFAKGLEKRFAQATKALDKIVAKYREFKDSIRSGFDSLGDFGSLISSGVNEYLDALKAWEESTAEDRGPAPAAFDISGAIAAQVAQAQALAKLLTEAAAAGLSKGLLAQFASQGAGAIPALEELLANPELITQLNQAAATIAAAANNTAEALGEKFFAKAIRNAANKLDHLADALVRFIARLQRMLGEVSAGIQKQLDAIQAQAQAAAAAQTAGGGNGGNGGGKPGPKGGSYPHYPGGMPNPGPRREAITVNVHGWVGSDQQIAAKVRDELVRVSRNNGTTGLN